MGRRGRCRGGRMGGSIGGGMQEEEEPSADRMKGDGIESEKGGGLE